MLKTVMVQCDNPAPWQRSSALPSSTRAIYVED